MSLNSHGQRNFSIAAVAFSPKGRSVPTQQKMNLDKRRFPLISVLVLFKVAFLVWRYNGLHLYTLCLYMSRVSKEAYGKASSFPSWNMRYCNFNNCFIALGHPKILEVAMQCCDEVLNNFLLVVACRGVRTKLCDHHCNTRHFWRQKRVFGYKNDNTSKKFG